MRPAPRHCPQRPTGESVPLESHAAARWLEAEAEIAVVMEEQSRTVLVGALDPIDLDTGVLGRLSNLGYLLTPADDADHDELWLAVEELQDDLGIPFTGAIDDATRSQLKTLHGV